MLWIVSKSVCTARKLRRGSFSPRHRPRFRPHADWADAHKRKKSFVLLSPKGRPYRLATPMDGSAKATAAAGTGSKAQPKPHFVPDDSKLVFSDEARRRGDCRRVRPARSRWLAHALPARRLISSRFQRPLQQLPCCISPHQVFSRAGGGVIADSALLRPHGSLPGTLPKPSAPKK